MPNTYEGTFSINGIRTTERVVANDQTSAKKLMEMRYPGAKISWHKLPNKVKDQLLFKKVNDAFSENFHLECKSLTNLYIFTVKI